MLTKDTLWGIFENLPAGVTIGKRSGEPTRHFPIEPLRLEATTFIDIFLYGVQRWVNDGFGGSNTTLDQKAKEISLLIPKMYDGS